MSSVSPILFCRPIPIHSLPPLLFEVVQVVIRRDRCPSVGAGTNPSRGAAGALRGRTDARPTSAAADSNVGVVPSSCHSVSRRRHLLSDNPACGHVRTDFPSIYRPRPIPLCDKPAAHAYYSQPPPRPSSSSRPPPSPPTAGRKTDSIAILQAKKRASRSPEVLARAAVGFRRHFPAALYEPANYVQSHRRVLSCGRERNVTDIRVRARRRRIGSF